MARPNQGGEWQPFSAYLSSNPYVPSDSLSTAADRPPSDQQDTTAIGSTRASETAQAMGNAVTLGLSLASTLLIGFAVLLLAPRWLGPQRWGQVRGAEALMALVISFIAFGFDTYIRKEVAVRREHAREFMPSVILFRTATSALAVIITTGVLYKLGKTRLELALVVVFGVSKYLIQTGELFAACLHATGQVSGIRRITLPSKLLWAVLVIGGLQLGFGPIIVPIGWVIAEGLKTFFLGVVATRALSLTPKPTPGAFAPVMRASIPYSAGIIVAGSAMFLDVTIMRFLIGDTEVGYYSAAQNLASIAFAVGPLIPWVLMPLAAKAAARSTREMFALARRSFEFAVVIAVVSAVLLALNADVVLQVQGPKFTPAVRSLRLLAIVLALTYFIMMASVFLQTLGRAWAGVQAALVGLVINGVLNLAFQRRGLIWFGEGGAGIVAGMAAIVNEAFVAGAMLIILGRRAWDDRTFRTLRCVLGASIPVILCDRILAGWGFSWLRLVADVVVYGANLMLLNTVDLSTFRSQLSSFRSRRSSR